MSYIDVAKLPGNRTALVKINEYGEKVIDIKKFQGTVFEEGDDGSGWTDVSGKRITPIKVKSVYQYTEENEGFINKYFAGTVPETLQLISEEYPGEIKYNEEHISKCYFDIEVNSTQGFPDPWDASQKVVSISLHFSKTNKTVYIDLEENGQCSFGEEIKHYRWGTEKELIRHFWSLISQDVCMLVGWNSSGFDIPYLINRSEALGIELKDCLPLKVFGETADKVYGHKTYKIPGFILYDYQSLIKKYEPESLESYGLDYVAKKYLGEGKVSYHVDHSSLQDLFEEDYQKFAEYNIKDTMLIVEIDEQRKIISRLLKLAYMAKILPNDVFSSQKLWDGLIYNKLKEEKIAVPRKVDHQKTAAFIGGYVKEPIRGMHDWVVGFDVNSLYPNIMIMLNMSANNQIPYDELPEEIKTNI